MDALGTVSNGYADDDAPFQDDDDDGDDNGAGATAAATAARPRSNGCARVRGGGATLHARCLRLDPALLDGAYREVTRDDVSHKEIVS